jgi:hypothetical protein
MNIDRKVSLVKGTATPFQLQVIPSQKKKENAGDPFSCNEDGHVCPLVHANRSILSASVEQPSHRRRTLSLNTKKAIMLSFFVLAHSPYGPIVKIL